jgi:predicted DNA-binding WGR domain protein
MSKPVYNVSCTHGKHEGGTKSYRVWMIRADNKMVVVAQWGKNGALVASRMKGGELNEFAQGDIDDCRRAARRQVDAKRARGYAKWDNIVDQTFPNVESLKLWLRDNSDQPDSIYEALKIGTFGFGGATTTSAPVATPVNESANVAADWGTW